MFRRVLFWIHLVAGLLAGGIIAVLCFTGTVLAFEKPLVAWAERDARQIAPPAPGAGRLPLEELLARARAAQPAARAPSLVVSRDPLAAVAVGSGRQGVVYVNPYTGEVRTPASVALSRFLQTMTDVHRYLGFSGEVSRPRGKLVTGIANLVFCVLALTGLYLWWPRRGSLRGWRTRLWFHRQATARAREFHWHHVVGFWSAPVLIVLTLTAVPISFRWGGTLLYTLTGTPAPAAGARGGPPPAPVVTPPSPTARPLSADTVLARVPADFPDWETLTVRPATAPTAWSVTVRSAGTWPRTATATVVLDPYTGAVIQRTGFADLNAAQQARAWTRFLHTGEALGIGGQAVAAVACLGGLFLVYSGVALSVRRFFGRPAPPPPA